MDGDEAADPEYRLPPFRITKIEARAGQPYPLHSVESIAGCDAPESRLIGRDPEEAGELSNHLAGCRDVASHRAMATLDDGPAEEASSKRRGHEVGDRHGAGRLPERRHIVWIAAKGCDIVPDPLEGGNLISEPQVGRNSWDRKETFGAEAIVDGDADHAVTSEGPAFMDWGVLAADHESAAVNPDHHGQVRPSPGRSPEVQGEIVVARLPAAADEALHFKSGKGRQAMRCVGAGKRRVPHTLPLSRRLEARSEEARRGCCVRNAAEHLHRSGGSTAHSTKSRLYDRIAGVHGFGIDAAFLLRMEHSSCFTSATRLSFADRNYRIARCSRRQRWANPRSCHLPVSVSPGCSSKWRASTAASRE